MKGYQEFAFGCTVEAFPSFPILLFLSFAVNYMGVGYFIIGFVLLSLLFL